ncbi:hypothetical protein HMI55_002418 [Coelomomyces lativittatus]|nr:hypothetical protein HMI55_002418 [Coelomomyces lativittatus]
MDPILWSYGAAFWGWTEEETQSLLHHHQNEKNVLTSSLDVETNPFNHSTTTTSISLSSQQSSTTGNETEKKLEKEVGPQFMVFDHLMHNTSRHQLKTSKKAFNAFMSSTPAKIVASEKLKLTEKKNSTKEENEEVLEEKMLSLQDKELKDLLESSNFIEKYASEELVGKSRRHYQMNKLVELGMKPIKKQPVTQKTKMHLLQREKKEHLKAHTLVNQLGMQTFRKNKKEDQVLFLADRYSNKKKHLSSSTSMFMNTSSSSLISFASLRKKKNKVPSFLSFKPKRKHDRGLHGTLGRFKNGMLQLKKQDIQRIEKWGDQLEKAKNARKGSKKKKIS